MTKLRIQCRIKWGKSPIEEYRHTNSVISKKTCERVYRVQRRVLFVFWWTLNKGRLFSTMHNAEVYARAYRIGRVRKKRSNDFTTIKYT